MPLIAAAVCPHPPLIVPEVAAGAAAELDDLRAACAAAVAGLAASGAHRLAVVGTDEVTREYFYPFHGSFAGWGARVEVSLGPPEQGPRRPLPLSLLVAAWLIGRSFRPAQAVGFSMWGVAADEDPGRCARLLADRRSDTPWALLVMGDGSACRGAKSPGYDDPRAAPYDCEVSRALATADADALLGLDRDVSTQLKAAGRAPWQVLAGAVRATGAAWRGEVSYDAAPYGVGYLVATWARA